MAGIDPTVETEYWRSTTPRVLYFRPEVPYSYGTAYRFGWSVCSSIDRSLNEKRNSSVDGTTRCFSDESRTLSWEQARAAVKDSYERVFAAQEHDTHTWRLVGLTRLPSLASNDLLGSPVTVIRAVDFD